MHNNFLLTITHLSVAIDKKTILENISLAVVPGSVHALMGPNGSGKSTLAHTIMGHPRYEIVGGDIALQQESIAQLSPEKRAHKGIFLAFQYPLEIPGVTVATFLKEAYQASKQTLISVAEFQSLLYAAMDQLAIDRSFAQRELNVGFSGGEKKRFEMLQIMVLKPSLAILDEIDSGLDVDALQLVGSALDIIRREYPAMSIIIITHYHRIFNYLKPDFVHIVHGGSIVHSGNYQLVHAIQAHGYAQWTQSPHSN